MLKMNPFALPEALQVAHAVTFCAAFEQQVAEYTKTHRFPGTLQELKAFGTRAQGFAKTVADAAVEAYAEKYEVDIKAAIT